MKTVIGKGIPEVAGTSKAHGEGGAKFVDEDRVKQLGLPEDEHFYVSEEVRTYFARRKEKLIADYDRWQEMFGAWRNENPNLAKQLEMGAKGPTAEELHSKIPAFPADSKIATRKAGVEVLQPIAQAVPCLISGSADLHGSTLNYIKDGSDFTAENPSGRNIRFGIREHGMCAILNGVAYDGIFRASGATFLVFADYARPAIRLAALSGLPVTYIFTQDSIGVGEDGPTHQPVETVAGLRALPNLDVIRPADPEETAGAFIAAMERNDGPTLIALTRQVVPVLNDIPVDDRRAGVLKGGYIAKRESGELKTILLSSGSEVQHCIAAASELGNGVRVVSMPCHERFERQPEEYREQVLPTSCRRRIAIEAGVPMGWDHYLGLDGKIISLRRFGLSAPGGEVMKQLGITADEVIKAARELQADIA